MNTLLDKLHAEIAAWPGITAQPHRFGGVEFNLGRIEVGHVHSNGMVDIAFNRKLRDQLLAEERVEPHHLLPETGWISFYIRSPQDEENAVWLFRLSYLFHAGRGQNRLALQDKFDLADEVTKLHLSPALQSVFASLSRPVEQK